MSNPHYAICEEDYTIHPFSAGDLDGRDFPWAPRVPMKELRSGKDYPQLFTGTYTQSVRLGDKWSWEACRVRHHGTQRYTNGDWFVGSFGNARGLPSEGTYTFADGNTLTGHFRNWRMGLPHGEGRLRLCSNSITMGTFYNKKLNMSYSGLWGLAPARTPTPGLCYLVESPEVGGYIVSEDREEGGITRAIYYRYGNFFKDYHDWLWDQDYWLPWMTEPHKDYDCSHKDPFPSLAELDLHPDSPEAFWLASFKTMVDLLIRDPFLSHIN